MFWSRKLQPTPVYLPGKFRGQRSLVGYNPWGCKESDIPEWKSMHRFIQKEWRVQLLVSPLLGIQDPQKVCLWRAVGLTFRRVRGRVQTKNHTYSRTQAEALTCKELRWNPFIDWRASQRAAWGHRHWWKLLLGACSTYGHRQVLDSTILKSFL